MHHKYFVHEITFSTRQGSLQGHKTFIHLGKPQKKVLLLMAGPLRPYPPPASVGNFERWKKKFKNLFFFLNGPAFTLPPLNGPAIKRITFFRLPLLVRITSTNRDLRPWFSNRLRKRKIEWILFSTLK